MFEIAKSLLKKTKGSSSKDSTAQPDGDLQRVFAARVSLIAGSIIMLLKFFAYRITHSEAILSDALESIVNVVAALIVVLTIKYMNKPADKDHPYGHGKVEYFSAAFEGGLISFAAFLILIEASAALLYGHELQNLGVGLIVVIGAGLANALLGFYLLRRGEMLQSFALQSSGKHVLSDVWTSVGIVLGLLLASVTGWIWLDALIALGFGFYLAYVGWGIVSKAIGGLMDKEDPVVIDSMTHAIKLHLNNGIIDVHEMKLIRSGRYHHIDMHLVLPEFWTIAQAHERASQFEADVLADYPYDGEMNFHYDPCRRQFCRQCDLNGCPIRQAPFEPANISPVSTRPSH